MCGVDCVLAFGDSQCSQDSVDEQDAVEGLAEGLDFLDAFLVVGLGAVYWEDSLDLREVEHFGGLLLWFESGSSR